MFRISHNPSSGYTIYKFTRDYITSKTIKKSLAAYNKYISVLKCVKY